MKMQAIATILPLSPWHAVVETIAGTWQITNGHDFSEEYDTFDALMADKKTLDKFFWSGKILSE